MTVTARLDESVILASLESYSRQPFQDALARILGSEPTPQKIKAFASKHPDRWGQLVAIFGRLAGYSEKVEVANTSILLVVKNSSDSELLAKITEIESRLKQLGEPVEEAQIINQSAAAAPETPETH